MSNGGREFYAHIWEASTGKRLRTLPMCNWGVIYGLTWSPDGRTLATGSGDGTLRFWDRETGRLHGTILRRGDDRTLVVGADGNYRATPVMERQLVVVVVTADGRQETLSIAEFSQKYGWKNDPDKVRLSGEPPAGAAKRP